MAEPAQLVLHDKDNVPDGTVKAGSNAIVMYEPTGKGLAKTNMNLYVPKSVTLVKSVTDTELRAPKVPVVVIVRETLDCVSIEFKLESAVLIAIPVKGLSDGGFIIFVSVTVMVPTAIDAELED